MKRYIPIIVLMIILISGCNAFKTDDPTPDNYDYSHTYMPLITGNTWTYIHDNNIKDTIISSVANDFYVLNGVAFQNIISSNGDHSYYGQYNNYYYMLISPTYDATIAVPILDEYGYDGYSVTTIDSVSNIINPPPIRSTLTIVQSNYSKEVNGKTYENVIHSHVVIEYLESLYSNDGVYDFYFAKDVGLIEIDKGSYDTQTIVSYKF